MKVIAQGEIMSGKHTWHRRLVAIAVASIPMYSPSKLLSAVITLPDVFILAFVVWTLLLYGFPNKLFQISFGWILVGTVVIPLISILMNYAILGAEGDFRVVFRTFEAMILALCIAWSLIKDAYVRNYILYGLFWGLGLVVVEGWIQYLLGSISWIIFPWLLAPDWLNSGIESSNYLGFRVYSLLDNPLNLVAYISIPMSLLIWKYKNNIKIFAIIGFILTVGVSIFSGSKITVLIIFFSIFYWAWGSSKKKLFALIIGLIGIAVTVNYLPKVQDKVLILNRIVDSASRKESVEQRSEVYFSATRMIFDYPLLGVGPGNYPGVYNKLYRNHHASSDSTTFTSENFLLQIGAEQGIPSLLLMLWLCTRLMLRFSLGGIHEGLAFGLFLFLLVGMIQSMTSVPIRLMLYVLFGFSEGLVHPFLLSRRT